MSRKNKKDIADNRGNYYPTDNISDLKILKKMFDAKLKAQLKRTEARRDLEDRKLLKELQADSFDH